MKPNPTHLTIRSALRKRTRRGHRSPYLCVLALALAGALPSFAANLVVQNTNDSGAGSLRQAIADAASGDTIQFSPSVTGTITLTSGMLTIDKNLTITGPGATKLAIDGNHAGRVLYINSGVTASISGVTIQNGVININGGGIFNQGSLTLTNSKVSGNSGGNSGGGIDNEGSLTLTNSTVSGNLNPDGDGGGIASYGPLTLTNSTVAGNSASLGFGGGIANYGTATLTNSTVSGNSSYEGGGAILNVSESVGVGALTITDSTVSGNSSSSEGSGILNEGLLTVKSTLFAGNTAAGNCDLVPNNTVTSLGYNLSDDATCNSAFTQTGDKNSTSAQLDPKGLQSNGGPTQTIALLPGSPSAPNPAVDAIPAADCTDANGKPVTTDQRGITRPQGKGCDIGAYELVQTVPFSNFTAYLLIDTGKHHPGFALNSDFTLGSAGTGLQPASEAMTLEIANYTLILPAGSFHQLWKAPNAPYVYEGTVNGAKLVLGLIPLGNNQFQFDAAGSPVTFPGLKNPVTVSLSFGNDSGATTVNAIIAPY